MEEIGWVEGLCDRPGVVRDPRAALGPASVAVAPQQPAQANVRRPENPPAAAGPAPGASAAPLAAPVAQRPQAQTAQLAAATASAFASASASPKSQGQQTRPASSPGLDVIANSEQGRSSSPPPPAPTGSGTLPSAEQEKKRLYDLATATALLHQDYRVRNPDPRPSNLAGQTAEQEKERLFHEAQQTRDKLQGSIGPSGVRAPLTSEDEKKALHDAAIARRDQVQQGLAPISPPVAAPAMVRSSTQPLNSPPSSPGPALGRSNSVMPPAEAEKVALSLP